MASVPFPEARRTIVAVGRWLDEGLGARHRGQLFDAARRWHFAVTVSGRHKGRLTEDDVMRVDAAGAFARRQETLRRNRPAYGGLYRDFPDAGAVLHSHSPAAVGLSRAFPDRDGYTLARHEMLKVAAGHR
jgi:methylthioribulose-1-phosphate dehydratase